MLFVSYSRLDSSRLIGLMDHLKDLAVDYWVDTANIPVGEAFVARIGQALRRSLDLLLVDTQASRQSYWVSRELGAALRRRREGRLRWIFKFQVDPIEKGQEIRFDAVAFDAVADAAVGWGTIEQLLKATPARQGTPEEMVPTLEPLLATRDTGQPQNWAGRQEELDKLDVWWRSGSPLAWVEGIGGLGKSGLIRTWIVAFNELGYESNEKCVTGYISGPDLDRGRTELEKWTRAHSGERQLLMIDGFDEAQEANLALAFAKRAVDAGIRVLVSSRSTVPAELASVAMNLVLPNLAIVSGEEIFRNAGLDEHVAFRLVQRFGGSPLMLSLIARHLSDGRAAAEDLLKLDQMESGLGELLARVIGTLSPDARRLLETIAVNEQLPAPDSADQGLISPLVQKALQELTATGLIATRGEREARPVILHEAIRNWVLGNLNLLRT